MVSVMTFFSGTVYQPEGGWRWWPSSALWEERCTGLGLPSLAQQMLARQKGFFFYPCFWAGRWETQISSNIIVALFICSHFCHLIKATAWCKLHPLSPKVNKWHRHTLDRVWTTRGNAVFLTVSFCPKKYFLVDVSVDMFHHVVFQFWSVKDIKLFRQRVEFSY